jgi:ABC-type nitrate/sulfonate/bicarbonate transport system substrate-binding protein
MSAMARIAPATVPEDPTVSNPPTRRSFLALSGRAGVVGLALPTLLAACGDDDDDDAADTTAAASDTTVAGATDTTAAATDTSAPADTTPATDAAPPDYGSIDFRLSWTPGVAFGASYIATSEGYYAEEGFSSVNLVPGGPSATPSPTDVATGVAFAGVAVPDNVASAIVAGGASLKILGALYQKNAFCITSMTSNPIEVPEDIVGKKIGVQAGNEAVWAAFLAATGIDAGSFEKVVVQFDPTPVTTGEVDGWLSFVTNEPVNLRAQGFDVTTMLFADHGYPLVSQVYIASDDSIADDRDKLKAFLRAEIRGWLASMADLELAATLVVEEYAADLGLDLDAVVATNTAQAPLIITPDTQANGLLTMTDDLVAENIDTLALSDITITAEELFDLSLLAEIYEEDPSLVEAAAALPLPA